ncbi:MAG: ester cyclase [Actinomycetota bacterium]|nr:ester cyclase [Actinomycetota bacterium]
MTAVGTLVDRVSAMVERINAGDLDGYMSGYASTVVPHGYPEGVTDFESLRGFYRQLLRACDGFRVEVLRAVEQDDVVALQFVLQGRHTGELLGAAPSGRDLVLNGATFLRFHEQLVVERWQHADDLSLMQQLGLLPAS